MINVPVAAGGGGAGGGGKQAIHLRFKRVLDTLLKPRKTQKHDKLSLYRIRSDQSLSRVQLFATP